MKYTKTKFLMWTDISITIISNKNPLQDIYDSFALFYSLEQEFSRFSKTSDLVLLNEEKTLEVSDRFIDVFKKSYDVYNQSNHFFNPLVNIKNIWYSTDFWKWVFEKTNLEVNLDLDKVSVIWNFLTLKENQNLDLGGIVKWYWVDLVSDFLKEKWYSDFIINAWWDIYLYWNNSAWKTPVVWIDSPFNSNELFATLEIKNKSISTSGTYKRKWELANEKYHHILTPETNTNNNEIISITLISDKCYISDSYATACIAMGIEKSLVFLQEKNIDWFLIWSDWNIYQTKNLSSYNIEII